MTALYAYERRLIEQVRTHGTRDPETVAALIAIIDRLAAEREHLIADFIAGRAS